MKLIPLTKGQFAKVDDSDFNKFGHLTWRAEWAPGTKSFYAVRSLPRDADGNNKNERMHRMILGLTDSRIKADHINHDTLDNQRHNLRPCTQAQNGANRKNQANNTSGFRGVYWNKRSNKWQAQLRFKGKRMSLGYYHTLADAADAYAAGNKKYFGEFGGVA